ncbi:hypothetical protein PR048_018311 [Dryococelus australis]|uniref:Uncharacterized protein n=1 Tax=Dryococelus australis TaxID=614101 RepID=A0ABQ9HC25_9NEOP|nr:hypothetical protein PR048_018311 [Dryococelus australis]
MRKQYMQNSTPKESSQLEGFREVGDNGIWQRSRSRPATIGGRLVTQGQGKRTGKLDLDPVTFNGLENQNRKIHKRQQSYYVTGYYRHNGCSKAAARNFVSSEHRTRPTCADLLHGSFSPVLNGSHLTCTMCDRRCETILSWLVFHPYCRLCLGARLYGDRNARSFLTPCKLHDCYCRTVTISTRPRVDSNCRDRTCNYRSRRTAACVDTPPYRELEKITRKLVRTASFVVTSPCSTMSEKSNEWERSDQQEGNLRLRAPLQRRVRLAGWTIGLDARVASRGGERRDTRVPEPRERASTSSYGSAHAQRLIRDRRRGEGYVSPVGGSLTLLSPSGCGVTILLREMCYVAARLLVAAQTPAALLWHTQSHLNLITACRLLYSCHGLWLHECCLAVSVTTEALFQGAARKVVHVHKLQSQAFGAMVVERLDYLPPTKAIRVQLLVGSLRIFALFIKTHNAFMEGRMLDSRGLTWTVSANCYIREISNRTGVPTDSAHRTLRPGNYHLHHTQRLQSLLPADHRTRVEFCQEMLRRVGQDDLSIRKTPFVGNRSGRKWFESFLKRHPEVSERYAGCINKAQENAIEILEDPTRVFNADKTRFKTCPKTVKVLGPVLYENSYEIKSGNEKEALSVMTAFSAAGLPCEKRATTTAYTMKGGDLTNLIYIDLRSPIDGTPFRFWPLRLKYVMHTASNGNTALLARRSDEALGVRVSVALIAPSLLDLGRAGEPFAQLQFGRCRLHWFKNVCVGAALLRTEHNHVRQKTFTIVSTDHSLTCGLTPYFVQYLLGIKFCHHICNVTPYIHGAAATKRLAISLLDGGIAVTSRSMKRPVEDLLHSMLGQDIFMNDQVGIQQKPLTPLLSATPTLHYYTAHLVMPPWLLCGDDFILVDQFTSKRWYNYRKSAGRFVNGMLLLEASYRNCNLRNAAAMLYAFLIKDRERENTRDAGEGMRYEIIRKLLASFSSESQPATPHLLQGRLFKGGRPRRNPLEGRRGHVCPGFHYRPQSWVLRGNSGLARTSIGRVSLSQGEAHCQDYYSPALKHSSRRSTREICAEAKHTHVDYFNLFFLACALDRAALEDGNKSRK